MSLDEKKIMSMEKQIIDLTKDCYYLLSLICRNDDIEVKDWPEGQKIVEDLEHSKVFFQQAQNTRIDESNWNDSDFEIKYSVLMKYHGKGGKVVIPSSVTCIGKCAFESCNDLTSVTIPNSVTIIGDYAFHDCRGLTSVTIGNGVISIGLGAFFGCKCLESITIPDSVTSIGTYAFSGCSALTSVTIPDSVTNIEYGAFLGDNLTSVTIPDNVTSIGNYAFGSCSSLTNVKILNPKLFEEVINNPYKSFEGTPWAAKVKNYMAFM